MGYVLELLPKEFITDNGVFLNASGQTIGGKIKDKSSNSTSSPSTSNIPSDVPASYREALDKANNKKAEALSRLNKLSKDLEYKSRLLVAIKDRMMSDNTGAISEGIVMSGRCGQQTFDKENLVVNLDNGVFAKGCSDPTWNAVGRARERDYANNYWRKLLPSEIDTIKSNILKESENIKSAEDEISKAEAAINKYLQTKAEYDLKQAEAKNFPEAQRIKAEKEQALRALEIQAAERSQRMALRSKNIRLGLFIGGGILLIAGGFYFYKKMKK